MAMFAMHNYFLKYAHEIGRKLNNAREIKTNQSIRIWTERFGKKSN